MKQYIFDRGVPTNPLTKATTILKYFPRARTPWMPSTFRRENVTDEDIEKMWNDARNNLQDRMYYHNFPEYKIYNTTVPMIPRSELEMYMPNLDLGTRALVTPVSLMSARDGHRVSHDLLHSYDPYISKFRGRQGEINHDRVHPRDPDRMGLHPETISSRARIYRWMRRSPVANEDCYFRRTMIGKDGRPVVSAVEAPLCRKIIRLANRGFLKAACEEYRRLTFIPPVEVYRALTAACVPGAMLADCISIFEDGVQLLWVTRDAEVFRNMMACAIAAKHSSRVLWVLDQLCGNDFENFLLRHKVERIKIYTIGVSALEYLLDSECEMEARQVYDFFVRQGFLQYDLHVTQGRAMRLLLSEGKKILLPTEDDLELLSVSKAAASAGDHVAKVVYASLPEHQRSSHPGPHTSDWLRSFYADLDVSFVLRIARFDGDKDLHAKDSRRYFERCMQWLHCLSRRKDEEGEPLSYMLKSKASVTHENLRVAAVPEGMMKRKRLLPSEDGYQFHFDSRMRFVEETFPSAGETLQSRYLAVKPIQREVPCYADFSGDGIVKTAIAAPRAKVLHPRLTNPSQGEGSTEKATYTPVNPVARSASR